VYPVNPESQHPPSLSDWGVSRVFPTTNALLDRRLSPKDTDVPWRLVPRQPLFLFLHLFGTPFSPFPPADPVPRIVPPVAHPLGPYIKSPTHRRRREESLTVPRALTPCSPARPFALPSNRVAPLNGDLRRFCRISRSLPRSLPFICFLPFPLIRPDPTSLQDRRSGDVLTPLLRTTHAPLPLCTLPLHPVALPGGSPFLLPALRAPYTHPSGCP
jgi:hypothetical protein